MRVRNDVVGLLEKAMLDNWERDGMLYRTIIGIQVEPSLGKARHMVPPAFAQDSAHARTIALSMVIVHHCDAVFQISEGWKRFFAKGEPLQRPSTLPADDRDEIAMLTMATKNGQYLKIEYTVDRVTRKLVNREVLNQEPDVDVVLKDLWTQADRLREVLDQ